ncbi:MAG: tetratricopeptide repeat protein [Actinomycetota bacterium]
MPELTPADRVVVLLEWGDVAEADAAIEEAGTSVPRWQTGLWRAMRALMDGRFSTAERTALEAAAAAEDEGVPHGDLLAAVLCAASRRDQGRLAEAEVVLRTALDRHPTAPAGARALLALVIGEMGRDNLARQELARLLPRDTGPATGRLATLCLLAELAVVVGAHPAELDLLARRLAPHWRDCAVEEGGAVFYCSVAHALGRLAEARGRNDQALAHWADAADCYRRAGAPLLLAHVQRQMAATLRARGGPDDWPLSVHLLEQAARTYSRLALGEAAAAAYSVLAKSDDSAMTPTTAVFCRDGDGWLVGPSDQPSRLADALGLHDLARLLASARSPVHVSGLVGPPGQAPPVLAGQPWSPATQARWTSSPSPPESRARQEYTARLVDLGAELVEAERAGDAVAAALARAERDLLAEALSDGPTDPLDVAARAVAARARLAIDRIEAAQPEIGHHLRCSVRTGTFCSYEPDRPVQWQL